MSRMPGFRGSPSRTTQSGRRRARQLTTLRERDSGFHRGGGTAEGAEGNPSNFAASQAVRVCHGSR